MLVRYCSGMWVIFRGSLRAQCSWGTVWARFQFQLGHSWGTVGAKDYQHALIMSSIILLSDEAQRNSVVVQLGRNHISGPDFKPVSHNLCGPINEPTMLLVSVHIPVHIMLLQLDVRRYLNGHDFRY